LWSYFVSWDFRFDVPVILPDGKTIVTLADARQHLLTIPKAQYSEAIGHAAEALVMAAERRGPIMHANAALARLVYGQPPIPEPTGSKQTHWGRHKLARDR
jgi:hypothetical protein